MSQVQLNSNANSALQNTLMASQSMVNPSVYSTMPIYPATSLGFFTIEKSSGSVASSSQMSFNIPKYGIIEQILVTVQKNWATAGTRNILMQDVYACIDRVELLSSSRVISTLTSADLLAQLSDLEVSQFGAVQNGGVVETNPATSHITTFPLVFGFMEAINTQLNASFLEPMTLRISWGDLSRFNGTSTGTGDAAPGTITVGEPKLIIRYKNYDEEQNASLLSQNYDQPELNVVTTRWYDENPDVFTQSGGGAATSHTFSIQLKNTDCVESFYLMVRQMATPANAIVPIFCEITSVKFTASGQEILSLTGKELAYSKLTDEGWSTSSSSDQNLFAKKVLKIQMGCYGYGKLSNSLSLRELNNPLIEVTATLQGGASAGTSDGARYEFDCAEKCVAIYSTSSSTGRQNLALSN